jgi:hypothetical protein
MLDVDYRPACRAPGAQQFRDPVLGIRVVSFAEPRIIMAVLDIDYE